MTPPLGVGGAWKKKQIGLQKSCHTLCSNLCGRTDDHSDPGKTLLSFSCHRSKRKQSQPLWLSLILPLKPSGLPSTSPSTLYAVPPPLSNVNLYFIKVFLLLMHNSVTHIPLTHTNLTLVGGSAVLRLLVGRYTALYLREQDGDWCQ